MNRVVACITVVLMMAVMAYSQSLGEIARQNRQAKQANKKSAAHVFTNDDIPSVPVIREAPAQSPAAAAAESAAPASTSDEKKADGANAPTEAKATDTAKNAESPAETKAADDAQRARIEEQRKSVQLLQRELDVAQREHQIQTAVYYTDAGSRLRDPKDWTDKQKKYQDEMAAKGKALEDAKQKLQDLEDDARRSSK